LHRNDATIVGDYSIGNPHAVAIGGAAGSAVGGDDNAPIAIVRAAGEGRSGNRGAGQSQNKDLDAGTMPPDAKHYFASSLSSLIRYSGFAAVRLSFRVATRAW
jgi:hypothetical protein